MTEEHWTIIIVGAFLWGFFSRLIKEIKEVLERDARQKEEQKRGIDTSNKT